MAAPGSSTMSASKKQEGFWETLRTMVYAILVALVIRTFLFEPFNIPSGSMIPTLLVGDYLFVSKNSYSVRLVLVNFERLRYDHSPSNRRSTSKIL